MSGWVGDRELDEYDGDDEDERWLEAEDRHEEMLEAHEEASVTVNNPEDFHDEDGHFGDGFDREDGASDDDNDDPWDAPYGPKGPPDDMDADEFHDSVHAMSSEWMDGDREDWGDPLYPPDEWDADDEAELDPEEIAGPGAQSWSKGSDEDWSEEQLDEMRASIQAFNPDGDPDWGVPQDVLEDPEWEASGRDQGEYFRRKYGDDFDDEGDGDDRWEATAVERDDEDFADEPDDDDDDGGGGSLWSRIRGRFGGGGGADEPEGFDFDAADEEWDEPDVPEVDEPDVADDDTPDASLVDEANELTIEANERTLDEFDHDDPRGEDQDEDTGETGPVNLL